MPKFVSAQYVANDIPPPDQVIRAVDDEGRVWWHDDSCTQRDWLTYLAEGGTVEAAGDKPIIPPPEEPT
jgi:hypothetical protein